MLGNFTYENPTRVHFTTTGYYILTREDVAEIFRKSL